MRKIAVDIDGVLANLTEPFLEYYNQREGTNFRLENVHTTNFKELFGINGEEEKKLLDDFFKSDFFSNIQPIMGAQEAISHLSKRNHLVIVTARKEYIQDKTNEWIERFFPDVFSEIHFARNINSGDESKLSKFDICMEKGYEIIIEDDLVYANPCAEKGIKSILLNHPWNQEENLHPEITRVNNWQEVLEHLK